MVARQKPIVELLDASFSHVVAQLDVTTLGHGRQLFFRYCSRIAEHVRRKTAIGVLAHRARLDGHVFEGIGVFGDKSDIAQTYIARHHALALRARRGILNALAHHVVRQPEHGG